MKFSDFLLTESMSHKSTIDIDSAIKTIKEKCKLTDFNNPLIRATRGTDDAFIFNGYDRDRKSITKKNYHNVIMDHCIKNINKDYPLRSNSLICATLSAIDDVERFGSEKYVLFPYDETVVGYLTKSSDLNYASFEHDGKYTRVGQFKNILSSANIDDSSFNDLVSDISNALTNGEKDRSDVKQLIKLFSADHKNIEKNLMDFFSQDNLGYGFGSIKDVYKNKVDGECWLKGKCVAIKYEIWKKLIN